MSRKTRRRSSPPRRTGEGLLPRKVIRGVLLIGALILIVIFLFGDHGLYQLYRVRSEKGHLQDNIKALRAEHIELKGKKQRLETDFDYIERLARERYRMAKKGEKVFKVIDTGQKKNAPAAPTKKTPITNPDK